MCSYVFETLIHYSAFLLDRIQAGKEEKIMFMKAQVIIGV
jgi:hypothetical protein